MNLTPDFGKSKKLATKLLLSSQFMSFPFDVSKLNLPTAVVGDKNIMIDSLQNYCRLTEQTNGQVLSSKYYKDGFISVTPSVKLILYNEKITPSERINWTLAHELGHAVLGHTADDEKEEIEAHFFAANLFMPDDLVFDLYRRHLLISEKTLMLYFGVSQVAAEKKMETLRKNRWTYHSTGFTKPIRTRFQNFLDITFLDYCSDYRIDSVVR